MVAGEVADLPSPKYRYLRETPSVGYAGQWAAGSGVEGACDWPEPVGCRVMVAVPTLESAVLEVLAACRGNKEAPINGRRRARQDGN